MLAATDLADATQGLDFKRLARRLLAYARKRCQHLDLGRPGNRSVKGVGIEDLAAEGFTCAFSRRHLWTPAHGALEDFLFQQARSYIRRTPGHLLNSKENQITHRFDGTEVDGGLTQEELAASAERRQTVYALLTDPVERYIVSAVLDGNDLSGGEIASRLRVDVAEVYRANRRLKRNQALKDLLKNG